MSFIIDRRLNGKNKSAVNRQRFLERYRKHIKKAVTDAITRRSITDMESGESISIADEYVSEPSFQHGPGGKRSIVHPGNKDFITGDTFPRPEGKQGASGNGQASNQGDGEDEFVFQITQEEFLNFMFEDLELPNLVKRQLIGTDTFKLIRAGISNVGNPNRINIVRSLRSANARRIALSGSKRKRLKEIELLLAELKERDDENSLEYLALIEEMNELKARIKRLPFLDSFDLKYNLHIKEPQPSSKAVMFCIMDVSGSMNQATKEMAKRFFILLYLFLKRNYDHTEIVFIRHHTSAKEVDEDEFFYSRETGGTIVSSALILMKDIMDSRYPSSEWNVYAAQASDGDNWNDDSASCTKLLRDSIMPNLQHYSYVEITPREHQALWYEYEQLQAQFPDRFAMQRIVEQSDIYPVFHKLFQRKTT